MEKFFKSIFQSPSQDKKNITRHDETEGEGDSPVSDRRKLSMSRSGRLKQSYKKRHSLSLELYGKEDDIQQVQKQKSMEYHVHGTTKTPAENRNSINSSSHAINAAKSPEEEIDSAFEIIDKS